MADLFSVRELIEVAVEEERTGAAFYRALAESGRSEALRAFAAKLADIEQMHERIFRRLLDRTDRTAAGSTPAGDYMAYMVQGRIFPAGRDGREMARQAASDREAADAAMELERNTLLFYLEMRQFVPEGHRAALTEVIEEERQHLADWAGFKLSHF